ncbi:hypothetical protein E3N88_24833 [Mikania micrantha]|uniref:Uncharacterized protein n=1 Tax=Mikania micrantha TaxID=192012 RepID=A0A5N6N323_9ASTR|nr:hypothetical protein E3N88_24833 [Mikania micrantha]
MEPGVNIRRCSGHYSSVMQVLHSVKVIVSGFYFPPLIKEVFAGVWGWAEAGDSSYRSGPAGLAFLLEFYKWAGYGIPGFGYSGIGYHAPVWLVRCAMVGAVRNILMACTSSLVWGNGAVRQKGGYAAGWWAHTAGMDGQDSGLCWLRRPAHGQVCHCFWHHLELQGLGAILLVINILFWSWNGTNLWLGSRWLLGVEIRGAADMERLKVLRPLKLDLIYIGGYATCQSWEVFVVWLNTAAAVALGHLEGKFGPCCLYSPNLQVHQYVMVPNSGLQFPHRFQEVFAGHWGEAGVGNTNSRSGSAGLVILMGLHKWAGNVLLGWATKSLNQNSNRPTGYALVGWDEGDELAGSSMFHSSTHDITGQTMAAGHNGLGWAIAHAAGDKGRVANRLNGIGIGGCHLFKCGHAPEASKGWDGGMCWFIGLILSTNMGPLMWAAINHLGGSWMGQVCIESLGFGAYLIRSWQITCLGIYAWISLLSAAICLGDLQGLQSRFKKAETSLEAFSRVSSAMSSSLHVKIKNIFTEIKIEEKSKEPELIED